MCKRKRAERLYKRSTHQGPAKAGPATEEGWQHKHILHPEQQARANLCKKKYEDTQSEESVMLIVIFWCYFCHLHGDRNHRFLQSGRDVPKNKLGHVQATAESWKTCSRISSANILTPQPLRVKSTSVPGSSPAALWSFGISASRGHS